MKKIVLSSLLATTTVVAPVIQADSSVTELPDTVVTATRSETQKNQLTTASSVYTRQDIERLQAKTLPDLLRITPGIDITQQGGDGKLTSVFMRGTNSGHLLVLIDGIKFGSATAGTSPFEFVPIDQIERIEIVRGPQSSLYGSEAIGGVIQIFTRKGGDSETPKVTLSAGGGAYNSLKSSGTVSGKWKDSWYSFGASHYNTEGFSVIKNDDPDHDGYYNTAVHGRVGHRFNNNAEIDASFLRSSGRTDLDKGIAKTKFVNQVAALSGSMDLTDTWRSTLRLGQSLDYNDNFFPASAFGPAFITKYDTSRWNATWLNQHQLSDAHQVVWGSDYRLDEIASTDTFTKTSRYDVGVFAEWHGQMWDKHFFNASLRYDNNEAFGDYVSGNFSWRYNSSIGISPFASFGNAFKAPTLNDLYYKDIFGSHGDPNLRPEQSTSFEIGLAGNHRLVQWELRAYHTDIDNLITWFTDANTFVSIPLQTQKAQIDGLEAEISSQLLGWNNKLSMQLLRPVDRETNLRLIRRADKVLTYDLSRSFGQLDVGGTVLARGNNFDEDFLHKRSEVAGFVTVDLRAAYHVNKNWQISAKLNNLLDKQYQTVNTYNTADRNFFITVQYNN